MFKLSIDEYKCEIEKDIAVTNAKRVLLFSKFVVVIELLAIFLLFIPLLRTAPDHQKWVTQSTLALHSIILLAAILGWLVGSRYLRHLKQETNGASFFHKYLASAFLILILSMLALLSGIEQNITSQMTIYLVYMTLSSVSFLLPFPKNLFTFGFPFILYIIGILAFQSDMSMAVTHLINGSITFAAVLTISTMVYKYTYQNLQKKYLLEEANQRLLYHSKHDPLTDLLQRAEFESRVEAFMTPEQEKNNEVTTRDSCLVFIDIDNFRLINQVYGYLTGDQVVKSVAKILVERLPDHAIISRWAGQEFLVVFPGTPGSECRNTLEEIRESFEKLPVPLEEENVPELYISLSIGVAPLYGNYKPGFNDSFKKASEALSKAKSTGKNTIIYY